MLIQVLLLGFLLIMDLVLNLTLKKMPVYCHRCERDVMYLSSQEDPDSDNYRADCCPVCGCTDVDCYSLDAEED